MVHSFVRLITRLRWVIVVVWILAAIASKLVLPDLNTVVAHHTINFLPDSSDSIQTQKMLEQVDPEHKSKSSAVVAIHNGSGITTSDRDYFYQVLQDIDSHKSKYAVATVQDANNTDAKVASAFISQDKTTEIAVIGFPQEVATQQTSAALTQVRDAFKQAPQSLQVYFTGEVPIQQDDIDISQKGAAKTAIVTVVLVLGILLAVFRSVVAPFVTLLSIGLSFLITSGIVAWLGNYGLPVSTFTQTFLIAVLFGAGTDYSIILMNRFREELINGHHDKQQAIEASLRGVNKTVLYSGLTVLVSFLVLYFANFGLYRSAVGVAVGMLIVLATCVIFVPALMSILGGHLFWPRKPKAGMAHSNSKFWAFTSRLSVRHPWRILAVLLIVFLPIALLFTNQRTFDPMADIPGSSAVEGFHTISNAFGPGQAMPMNIVVKTDKDLRNSKGLTAIEEISKAMASLPNVKQVNSATRPTGEVIQGFQIANQNKQAADGMKPIQDGLSKLADQLTQGGSKVVAGKSGIDQLASGSQQVTSGMQKLQQGLGTLSQNTNKLAGGAQSLAQGASQMNSSMQTFAASMQKNRDGIKQVAQGLNQTAGATSALAGSAQQLSQGQQQLYETASSLANAIAQWSTAHPNDANDPAWKQIEQLAQAQQMGANQLAQSTGQLAQGMQQVNSTMPQLQQGVNGLDQAAGQLTTGTSQLAAAASKLAGGSDQLEKGTTMLSNGTDQLAKGANPLASGSQQVTNGVQTFASSFGQLSGLKDAGTGAGQINNGVQQISNYLQKSNAAVTQGNPGFYVPQSEVQSNQDLKKAMDAYISKDGHIANFTVILNINPYSTKAIDSVDGIKQMAQNALTSSPIHTGTIHAAGTTPTQAELNQISNADFIRTISIILIAIFILLVILLRSILAPVYIILSLAATYFITMGVLQEVAVHILHQPGLSWAVPFFVFLLLVALGVDYSIFLMSRFDEVLKQGKTTGEAIQDSMKHMGNVIFSAAIIMAGTFGSMIATGMTTMVEIGLAIIIGLLLYYAVLLAFFIPASVAVIAEGHHWPLFSKNQKESSKQRSLEQVLHS